MIDFSRLIQVIKDNGGFQPNSSDSSYYRTYTMQGSKPIQIRISNHGTHLWTWYDRDYDPSAAINLCVVFSENGSYDSNTTVDMRIKNGKNVVGQRKTFEVIQYVYNCQLLDDNDSVLINQAIQSLWRNKQFIDPLAGTPKHAKVMRLKPNESIEMITENKQYKHNRNMKQTIKLNENDIKRMVMEAINELDWKTYANAARKDNNKNRGAEFINAARDRFNDEYGYLDTSRPDAEVYGMTDFEPDWVNQLNPVIKTNAAKWQDYANSDFTDFKGKYTINPCGIHKNEWIPSEQDHDPQHIMDLTGKGNKEIEDYLGGNYEYVEGNGWTNKNLNEAITRAIRKVLR